MGGGLSDRGVHPRNWTCLPKKTPAQAVKTLPILLRKRKKCGVAGMVQNHLTQAGHGRSSNGEGCTCKVQSWPKYVIKKN